jgi:hypothetical protein
MSDWTPAELGAIDRADELEITSRRADGTLRPFVTIWVVRLGEDIYIRSAYGPDNGWFRRALVSESGRLRAGGVEKDVTFHPVATGHGDLDAVYHTKYDRYGPQIVGTVVSDESHAATLRLVALP